MMMISFSTTTFCSLVVFRLPASWAFLRSVLDGVHHVLLLAQEGVADFRGHIKLLAHGGQHGREIDQRLDARIPGLFFELLGQNIPRALFVAFRPAISLDHLKGVGRGHEDLGNQIVRIEGDRRQQLGQLFLRQLFL